MSKLSTTPVVKCRRCGKVLIVKAQTFKSDAGGELLQAIARVAMNDPLCDFHSKQRAYYAQQNRLDDWENGRP